MKSALIIKQIIQKGGLMGQCAKMYIGDESREDLFILECYQQTHNKAAIKLWGEELVFEIRKYKERKTFNPNINENIT